MEALTALKPGETGIIEKVEGGISFVNRVSDLGFISNVRLTVLQNYSHGPVLVCLKDSKIALGRGEAEKIKVRRI